MAASTREEAALAGGGLNSSELAQDSVVERKRQGKHESRER
jgi:hypothetical protein